MSWDDTGDVLGLADHEMLMFQRAYRFANQSRSVCFQRAHRFACRDCCLVELQTTRIYNVVGFMILHSMHLALLLLLQRLH